MHVRVSHATTLSPTMQWLLQWLLQEVLFNSQQLWVRMPQLRRTDIHRVSLALLFAQRNHCLLLSVVFFNFINCTPSFTWCCVWCNAMHGKPEVQGWLGGMPPATTAHTAAVEQHAAQHCSVWWLRGAATFCPSTQPTASRG